MMRISDYKETVDTFTGETNCPACSNTRMIEDYKLAVCPICAYVIRHHAFRPIAREEEIDIKQKAQRLWLRHCVSTEALYHFSVLEIDPEGDAYKIFREGLLSREQPLFSHIASMEGVELYRNAIIDWFLRRYNWIKASTVYLAPKHFLFSKACVPVLCILALLILLFSLLSVPKINFDFEMLFYPSAVGVSLVVLIFLGLTLLSRDLARFSLPRMIGASFIGLLPLITQKDMWLLPLRFPKFGLIAMGGTAFLASVIYLLIDARRSAMISISYRARQCSGNTNFSIYSKMIQFLLTLSRALPIALYGLLVSMVLSIMACDIIGMKILIENGKPISEFMEASYPGIFGRVSVNIVVFFSFIALMIGIFVQIFWDEKTATQPLQ